MVDPLTLITMLGAGADTAEVLATLRSLVDREELDRVLEHIDALYGESTGLSAAQLESWKTDDAFVAAFVAVSVTADWDTHRGALLDAVLGLTAEDPLSPRPEESELAEDVVAEIEYQLPQAKKGDDVTRYVARQNRLAIEALGPVRPDLYWTPERGRALFDELTETSEAEATELHRALRNKDLANEIPALMKVTPVWLEQASGLAWEVLAASAEDEGLWPEAVALWQEAFERAGSDRVRTLVRLATASHIAGDPEAGRAAFARAAELNPTHPLVLFTQAEQADDPEAALSALEQMEPTKDLHRALRALRRAVPLAELGRLEEAEQAIDSGTSEGAAQTEVAEVRAQVTLVREDRAFREGRPTDTAGLGVAVDHFLSMRDRHRDLGAHEGSVAYLTRAVDALLMAEERTRAISLMAAEELTEAELSSPLNRRLLAQQLMRAGRPDLAARMLADIDADKEDGRLLEAILVVQGGGGGPHVVAAAVAVLDQALSGEHRGAAAQARAIAALRGEADWSDEAGNVLAELDAGLAAVMWARWLTGQERFEEAEAALVDHMGEPRAQFGMLEIAIAREDRDRIVTRARGILEHPAESAVRLEAARALLSAEEVREAEEELRALAAGVEAPLEVRASAFGELAELFTAGERNQDLLENCEDWLAMRPEAINAAWGRMHALYRLGRFADALAAFEESGARADSLGRAQLLVRTLAFALPTAEAIERVLEVADSLDQPDEGIEALALFLALEADEELSPALAERLAAERFLALFPETTLIQKLEIPGSAEGLLELLERIGGDREEHLAAAWRSVLEEAEAPVALPAILAGRTVAETWRAVRPLPVGFAHTALLEDERAFAADALTLGAVWDPGALYFAEALGGTVAEELRRLLPASAVAQSTLDDVISDSGPINPTAEGGSFGRDETGRLVVIERSAAERTAEAEMAGRVKALAGTFAVEPDSSHQDIGPAGRFLREAEELRPQFLTVIATLAVAERRRLPVFSADRYVRTIARQSGIRTFGPEAMIEALADRGEVEGPERSRLRRELRGLGALGTVVTGSELVAEARDAGFELTRALAFALLDPTPLRIEEAPWYLTLLELLRAVDAEAPEKLEIWTARVIDALDRNHKLGPAAHGSRLLALAFAPGREEAADFSAALGRSVVWACELLGARREPVTEAARLLYRALISALPWQARAVLVAQFANQMPAPQSSHARFVIFEGPDGPMIPDPFT